MGYVSNTIIAMPSGFYLGSYISLKGEGSNHAVKELLTNITGGVLESAMYGKIKNTIAMDRGYLTEDTLNTMISWGISTVGTLKRCKLAPFSYGDGKTYKHQKHVPLEGPRMDYYSVQNVQDSNGRCTKAFAGLHRTGLRKAFMTHTTMRGFQPYVYDVTLASDAVFDTTIPQHFATIYNVKCFYSYMRSTVQTVVYSKGVCVDLDNSL